MLFGFTLAEVLIVLGIIGLIADMTIPTVIAKTEEKIAVTRLKKAYSTLQQAYSLSVSEYGPPQDWNLGEENNSTGAETILNNLTSHMKVIKNCGVKSGCLQDIDYRLLSGDKYSSLNSDTARAKALLADGSILVARVKDGNCNINKGNTPALKNLCAYLHVDINGYKQPNKVGEDYFEFIMTTRGVLPTGTAGDTYETFEDHCKDAKTQTGYACGAWIIYNENMDYLHCSDLAWDGKKSCKSSP